MKINIGIIGYSNFAKRKFIPALLRTELFSLTAIASKSTNKLEGEIFEGVTLYNDYYDLINDQRIHLVYISTPNNQHFELAKASLEAEKHVLSEKPLSFNFEHVTLLQNYSKSKKVVLWENYHFPFHKRFNFIKSLISSKTLGKLRLVRSDFGFRLLNRDDIRYQIALGGGAFSDCGVYPIRLLIELFGVRIKLRELFVCKDPIKKVDLYGSATLEIPAHNAVSQISWGFDNQYRCDLEIWGEKGYLRARKIFTCLPESIVSVEIETDDGLNLTKFQDDQQKNLLDGLSKEICLNDKSTIDYKISQHALICDELNKKILQKEY